MPNCINCSAPLPKDSAICSYCKTRNDVDLRGLHKTDVKDHQSKRVCPRCNVPMQTIDLKVGGEFLIERCLECYGLFFDPGELEILLEKSVSNVFSIKPQQIGDLNKMKRAQEYPVGYIKCPVCQKLMNRLNFGARSGVIIDTCKEDGIWLDGGELRHLMEWMKAGGKILNQQNELEKERLKLQEERKRVREQAANLSGGGPVHTFSDRGFDRYSYGNDVDLLGLIVRGVSKLFKF